MHLNRINASAVTEQAVKSGTIRYRVSVCKNLRPVYDSAGRTLLRAIGPPRRVADGPFRAIESLCTPDGRYVTLLLRGRLVYYITTKRDGHNQDGTDTAPDITGEPETIGELPGDYNHSILCGGRLLVTTNNGIVFIDIHQGVPRMVQPPHAEAFDCFRLDSVRHTVMTERVGPRRLGRVYRAGETMPDASDRNKISADLHDAYDRLCGRAASGGYYLQPLIARYAVYDATMNELYRSAPVFLSHPDGSQCLSPVSIRSSDRRHLESYDLQAESWCIRLSANGTAIPVEAAYVSVLVSPQLHPTTGRYSASINLMPSGSADFARVSLSAETAISESNAAVARHRLRGVISRLEELEQVVDTIAVNNLDNSHTLSAGSDSLAGDQAKLTKALSKSVHTADTTLAYLNRPHSFTALCGDTGPSAILWGGIKSRRYSGYPIGMFTALTEPDKAWHAWIRIEFADGDAVVWNGQGENDAPKALTPILSYPAPDAVAMTVCVKTAGMPIRHERFALKSDSAQRHSIYIHHGFKPFELAVSNDSVSVIPPLEISHRYPDDCLAVADKRAPFTIKAVKRTGNGPVTAVSSAIGSQTVWDFGRQRYYVFDRGGISSVSVKSSMTTLAVTSIDHRQLRSANAVTNIDGQCWAVLSGDLVRLENNRAITVRPDCGYTALAWLSNKGELVGIMGNGVPEHTVWAHGCCRFTQPAGGGEALLTTDSCGHVLLSNSGGVFDLTVECTDCKPVPIEWTATLYRNDGLPLKPLMLASDIAAKEVTGNLSLHRCRLNAVAAEPDSGFTFSGELRSPAGQRVLARPATGWQLRLLAETTDDLTINGFVIGL